MDVQESVIAFEVHAGSLRPQWYVPCRPRRSSALGVRAMEVGWVGGMHVEGFSSAGYRIHGQRSEAEMLRTGGGVRECGPG